MISRFALSGTSTCNCKLLLTLLCKEESLLLMLINSIASASSSRIDSAQGRNKQGVLVRTKNTLC